MRRTASLHSHTRTATASRTAHTVLRLLTRALPVAVISHFAASPGASAAEFQLDLTHKDVEPGEAESSGAVGVGPGATGVGYGGMRPLLPVKISIRDISPRSVTPLDQILVEVVLRNAGKEAITLPFRSGRHWRTGVHGQRDIHLDLWLTPPGGKPVLVALGNAYGALDIPGSLVTLAPNDTLVIRASASLLGTDKWSGTLTESAEIKTEVSLGEARWDDTRFEIVNTSRLDMVTSPTPLTWFEAR